MPVPPRDVADAARRGLEMRREHGRGGTVIGVARARDLSNRRDIPPRTIARMASFFARHAVDAKAEGFDPGEKGYPSNGRIAHMLWGGDAGRRWAESQQRRLKKGDD
jgi:hypothetical protein